MRDRNCHVRGVALLAVLGLLLLWGVAPFPSAGRGTPAGALLPTGLGGDHGDPGAISARASGATVPVNFSLAPSGFALSPTFWGTTISAEAHLMPDEASIVAATPSRVLVWPGANAGDRVDMLNDTIITQNGTGPLRWHPLETNETQFIALCRAVHCTAILQVPGEIDDPSFAASVVNYTERTLGFYPSYWEIGNEPELWRYWQVPWDQWNIPPQTSAQMITPSEYAWEVHNYTNLLRIADPSIQILGLAGTGRAQSAQIPLSSWINESVAVNPSLAGVAFHVYTAGVWGNRTLQQFYAFTTGPWSVPGRVSDARKSISAAVNTTCPGCPDPQVLLTELGSGLSHYYYSNFSRTFPGGLAMAASEAEGMDLNLTTVAVFATELNTTNSWFSVQGAMRPNYAVYADLLDRLGPQVVPCSLQAPAAPIYTEYNTSLASNLFAVATTDPSDLGRADLLAINLNITTNVSFQPSLPGIAPGTPAELYQWSGRAFYSSTNQSTWVVPETPAPVATFFPSGIPSTWTLPPETVAVLESYPSGGAPVTFVPSGLSPTARWYLSVNGETHVSTSGNLSLFLPTGTSTLSSVPIPLPLGTFYPNPKERLQPFPPASVSVGSTPLTVPVPFVHQWALTITVSPTGGGTVAPMYPWANASLPDLLLATPAAEFVVGNWTGVGDGHFSGPGAQATVVALGSVQETIQFLHGFPVTFQESGLPAGASWTASAGGVSLTTTGSTLTFVEANGTVPISVANVRGFLISALGPTILMQGSPVLVQVLFTPIVGLYPVLIVASGLAPSLAWSAQVGSLWANSTTSSLLVQLPNGTYPYWISDAGTEEPSVRGGSLTVAGAPLVLPVAFAVPLFGLQFMENGLPPSTVWTITVAGATHWVQGDQLDLNVTNGTYAWSLVPPVGYDAAPSRGNSTVQGNAAEAVIAFSPVPTSTPSSGPAVSAAELLFLVAVAVALFALVILTAWYLRPPPPGGSGARSPRDGKAAFPGPARPTPVPRQTPAPPSGPAPPPV